MEARPKLAAKGVHDWCGIDGVSVGVRVGVACLNHIHQPINRYPYKSINRLRPD